MTPKKTSKAKTTLGYQRTISPKRKYIPLLDWENPEKQKKKKSTKNERYGHKVGYMLNRRSIKEMQAPSGAKSVPVKSYSSRYVLRQDRGIDTKLEK
jgi:hypothetical protein